MEAAKGQGRPKILFAPPRRNAICHPSRLHLYSSPPEASGAARRLRPLPWSRAGRRGGGFREAGEREAGGAVRRRWLASGGRQGGGRRARGRQSAERPAAAPGPRRRHWAAEPMGVAVAGPPAGGGAAIRRRRPRPLRDGSAAAGRPAPSHPRLPRRPTPPRDQARPGETRGRAGEAGPPPRFGRPRWGLRKGRRPPGP